MAYERLRGERRQSGERFFQVGSFSGGQGYILGRDRESWSAFSVTIANSPSRLFLWPEIIANSLYQPRREAFECVACSYFFRLVIY